MKNIAVRPPLNIEQDNLQAREKSKKPASPSWFPSTAPYAVYESTCTLCRRSENPTKFYFFRGVLLEDTIRTGEVNVFIVNMGKNIIKGEISGKNFSPASITVEPNQLMCVIPRGESVNLFLNKPADIAIICIHQKLLNEKVIEISKGKFNSADVQASLSVDALFLCQALEQLSQTQQTGRENLSEDPFYLESLYQVVLATLLEQHATMKKHMSRFRSYSPYQIKQVLCFIDANLNEDIKVGQLADIMGLSKHHFIRIFRELLGTSPYQYILDLRLEKAKELLEMPSLELAEIAHTLGFSSQAHFQTFFKKHTGQTPKVFRNGNRLQGVEKMKTYS